MQRLTVPRAIAYGGLVVGVLDIADAFIFFGLRGTRPVRILQSIAAGFVIIVLCTVGVRFSVTLDSATK